MPSLYTSHWAKEVPARLILYVDFCYPDDRFGQPVSPLFSLHSSLVLLLGSGVICSSLSPVSHPFRSCVVACCLLAPIPALSLFKTGGNAVLSFHSVWHCFFFFFRQYIQDWLLVQGPSTPPLEKYCCNILFNSGLVLLLKNWNENMAIDLYRLVYVDVVTR